MNVRVRLFGAAAACAVGLTACHLATGPSATRGEIEGQLVRGPICGADSPATCSDSPVAHTNVVVTDGDRLVATVTTSSDGRFDVPSVQPGQYEVDVAPGSPFQCTPELAPVTADTTLDVVVRCS